MSRGENVKVPSWERGKSFILARKRRIISRVCVVPVRVISIIIKRSASVQKLTKEQYTLQLFCGL